MISLEIRQDTKIEISEDRIKTIGKLGTNERKFNDLLINIKIQDNNIIIDSNKVKKLEKKAKKIERTFAKELSNDMKGVNEYYEIDMEIVSIHFPITAEISNKTFNIKNMVGERAKRSTNIIGNTKIDINNQKLKISGTSLDHVSQTAANIRKMCKIRHKDERIFQDGIYYSSKN